MAVFFKDANGNFFTAVKAGVGAPDGFEPVEANSVDAAKEKHVPAVELQRDGHIIHVQIGEPPHDRGALHRVDRARYGRSS